MIRSLISVLCLLLFCSTAHAWGTKEHMVLTRLAILRLLDDPSTPEGLKNFLKTQAPDLTDVDGLKTFFLTARVGPEADGLIGLSYWVILPDIRANNEKAKKVQPFDLQERLMHFVDLELLNEKEEGRVYRHDLSSRVPIESIPDDPKDPRLKEAGALHFAVRHSYSKLVECFKEGRWGVDPMRPGFEDHAARWTGYLCHYVQDNTQPQHSTQDYKSVSYFADKRTAPNVHSEVEWRMNDDEKELFPELRAAYWQALMNALPKAEDPAKSTDPFKATLEVADRSYSALPLIGLAAMHAAGQAGTPEAPTGPAGQLDTEKFFAFQGEVAGEKMTVLEMKARQQAWAVVRTAKLLRQAWDASR